MEYVTPIEEDFKDMQKEVQKYEKGDYVTEITSYFNKNGRLVGTTSLTKSKTLLPTKEEEELNQLILEKQEALELDSSEGYLKASELQKKILQLEEKLKNNGEHTRNLSRGVV